MSKHKLSFMLLDMGYVENSGFGSVCVRNETRVFDTAYEMMKDFCESLHKSTENSYYGPYKIDNMENFIHQLLTSTQESEIAQPMYEEYGWNFAIPNSLSEGVQISRASEMLCYMDRIKNVKKITQEQKNVVNRLVCYCKMSCEIKESLWGEEGCP